MAENAAPLKGDFCNAIPQADFTMSRNLLPCFLMLFTPSCHLGFFANHGMGTAILVVLLSLTSSLEALQLRTYSEARHDRFIGFPAAPVTSTTFIHKNVDLTGVGWRVGGSEPRSLTLVSPKFFVGARHFRPSVGDMLRFVAADGTVRSYTVKKNHNILNDNSEATDLSLGELVEIVATTDRVSFQPYLNLPNEAAYLAAPYNQLIVLGKRIRGGNGISNAINDFFGTPVTSGGGINNTRTLQFVYQNVAGLVDDAYAEAGDSGGPSLVNVDNIGAIVGIHTAILSAVGTTTTIDSFVAHPPYISQINKIMAAEGYHMTEANLESIALTFTPTVPLIIRAGYPANLSFEVSNPSLINDVNNLKLSYNLPIGSTPVSASGSLWLADIAGGLVSARKGGLTAAQNTSLATTLIFPSPDSFDLAVQYSADESSATVQQIPIEVIESYLSWSSELSDPAESADIDLDGFSNLLEYALGGDPEMASVTQADGVTQLAPNSVPSVNEAEYKIQYLRRTDAAQRALTYVLERSPSLESTSWVDASSEVLNTTTASVNDSFERLTVTLNAADEKMFYRVSISLSEEL